MDNSRKLIDIAALAALAWVGAATLHEGMGHGLACKLMGGDPLVWSTFHFDCGRQSLPLMASRIIAGAGTAVNVVLLVLGWLWWRSSINDTARLTGWIIFVVNGLTTFGYLLFSAAFGIGDWNTSGVIAGVSNTGLARAILAVIGIVGYVAIIRIGATMLSPVLSSATAKVEARQITVTVWVTLGIVSLLAALMAGGDWRLTIGASIGAALGGNAGLLTIPRFVTPSAGSRSESLQSGMVLWGAAALAVVAFVVILGPGIYL